MSDFGLLMKILNFYRLARQSFALGSFLSAAIHKKTKQLALLPVSSRQVTAKGAKQ